MIGGFKAVHDGQLQAVIDFLDKVIDETNGVLHSSIHNTLTLAKAHVVQWTEQTLEYSLGLAHDGPCTADTCQCRLQDLKG